MKFVKTKYVDNSNLAVVALEDDGEMYGSLTVNIDILPENIAALDTNNFPNAEKVAEELGAKFTDYTLRSGFCEYPVYDFSECKLEEMK